MNNTILAEKINLCKHNSEAAILLAEMRYRVHPLTYPGYAAKLKMFGQYTGHIKAEGKQPLLKNWQKLATTDPDTIERWWWRCPNANIGIATGRESNLFVLDIDGEEGERSFTELERVYGVFPVTLQVRTGSGGRHLYFKYPLNGQLGNSAGKLAPKIDTRGEGGYVVAPPSLHVCGRRYEFVIL